MRILAFITLTGLPLVGLAQNEVDALRYSWLGFGGSARYSGVGGAFGAVGGDMSCMAVNPAGLARFTKSEVAMSLGFSDISTNTSFNGTGASDGKTHFTVNNIGIIGAYTREDGKSDWKSIQFGLAYNKLANFNNEITITGTNNDNTLLDVFAADANGISESNLESMKPFTSYLAYWTYCIDPVPPGNNTYTTQIPYGAVVQTRTISRKGAINETGISLSGNYMDKLYLGATIGIPGIRFEETYNHEEDVQDTSLQLVNFSYRQHLVTKGIGINAKIGAIYLPVEWLRLGLAAHTRTGISLSDRWSSDMVSNFDNGDHYEEVSPIGNYDYRVKTPSRYIGSIAVVLKKWGFVSADYEWVNYSTALLKPTAFDPTGYEFNSENSAIKNNYTSASNIRLGGEIRIKPFMVRGGYAIYGSPFKDNVSGVDSKRITTSFGLGYRNNYFFCDASYAITKWKEEYYMYSGSGAAVVSNTFGQISVACGFRF